LHFFKAGEPGTEEQNQKTSPCRATALACCCCTDDEDETSPLTLVIAADKLAALLFVKTDVVEADEDADGCDDEEPNEFIDVAIRSAVELLDEDKAGCCC
jgi:hypothetical protein